jgi:hypothetical protein
MEEEKPGNGSRSAMGRKIRFLDYYQKHHGHCMRRYGAFNGQLYIDSVMISVAKIGAARFPLKNSARSLPSNLP